MVNLVPIPEKIQFRHGILEDYYEDDFNKFPVKDNAGNLVPERQNVLMQTLEYASNLKNARKEGISLWFYGGNGFGKSLLAISVQKMAIRQGYKTQFANLSGILTLIKRSWGNPELEAVIEKRIRNVDFLVIDDLGKEYKTKNNDFVEVVFDELVRYRCNRRLPMIITTNTSMDKIQSTYGNSVSSLLEGRCLQIELVGKGFLDFRKVIQARTLKARLTGKKVDNRGNVIEE
jgi:DNA replication protein DnaC